MKRYSPEIFREEINKRDTDVDIELRARAADHTIGAAQARDDQLTEVDVESALQLARLMAVSQTATTDASEIRGAPLPDTARSRQAEDEWLDMFAPLVERVRNRAFGSQDPPFDVVSLGAMEEWIQQAEERERWKPIDADSRVAVLREEAAALMQELSELAPNRFQFSETGGLIFTYLDSEGRLRPGQIGGVPDVHFGLHDSLGGLLSMSLPPIGVVAIAAREIAEITGFESHDVLLYILTGIRPRLHRVVWRAEKRYNLLPDGTEVAGGSVVVDFKTPDLTFRELQKLLGDIRSAWESLGNILPSDKQRRPGLTKKDHQLLRIIEQLDGVPDKPDASFWVDVHGKWNAAGYNAGPGKRKQADSHRRAWRILERKLEVPGVAPPVTGTRGQPTRED